MSEEITHLLGQGLITHSTSHWAAPIAVARKTNGQIRLAIDYRALNAQTFDQHQASMTELIAWVKPNISHPWT